MNRANITRPCNESLDELEKKGAISIQIIIGNPECQFILTPMGSNLVDQMKAS